MITGFVKAETSMSWYVTDDDPRVHVILRDGDTDVAKFELPAETVAEMAEAIRRHNPKVTP